MNDKEIINSFTAGLKKLVDKYYRAVEVQQLIDQLVDEYNVPYSMLVKLIEEAIAVIKEVDPWK